MGSDSRQSELVGRFPSFVIGEKEVDAAVRPVHIAGAVTELLFPTNSIFEHREKTVQSVEI
nr:hypothetical protein [Halolamina rubra]